MSEDELKNEDVQIYEIKKNEIKKEENNNINNNTKVKPIVRCIFCEKLENQFRRCEKPKEKEENNKRKKAKKKSSKHFNKEESLNGINIDLNNGVEEGGNELEKEKKENKNNISTENNLPTMITNVNKTFETYYKNFIIKISVVVNIAFVIIVSQEIYLLRI